MQVFPVRITALYSKEKSLGLNLNKKENIVFKNPIRITVLIVGKVDYLDKTQTPLSGVSKFQHINSKNDGILRFTMN